MRLEVDSRHGYLFILPENEKENELIRDTFKDLSFLGGEDYKLIHIKDPSKIGEYSNHLEFAVADDKGRPYYKNLTSSGPFERIPKP